jgi:hypothetical protein
MKPNFFRCHFLFCLLLLFVSAVVLVDSCKSPAPKGSSFVFTGDTIADGRKLVAQNCTGCHKLVEPDMLTKDVWAFHTLPSMAKYYGISTYFTNYYEKKPDSAKLSMKEWETIVAYYKKVAPATLPVAKHNGTLLNDWAGFSLKKPDTTNAQVFTTAIAANPTTGKIYTADATPHSNSGVVTEWDKALKPHNLTTMLTPVVNMLFSDGKDTAESKSIFFTSIGELQPVDFPNGRVVQQKFNVSGKPALKLIASELSRPVQTLSADFNKDGLNDLVICSEGHKTGGVYLYTQTKDHGYTQSTITDKPGAVQAITGDFNNDGYPDLMVLFGYNDEGLSLFLNDHKGGFTSRQLLQFPPVYGSTSFQLADLNHDGKPDLIYTCGYNFRDSRILKPYHGVYIYTNQGDWNFKQTWFYPINGCTKAIAADFDGDGDLDIATSAFFADMQHNPAESFIYFEQDAPMHFKPHAIPVSSYGRWFSMDVADVNSDGKPDILLGNFSHGFLFQPGFKPNWNDHLPFIVLENHTTK